MGDDDFTVPSVFSEDVTMRIVCSLWAGKGWVMLTSLFPLYSVRMKR